MEFVATFAFCHAAEQSISEALEVRQAQTVSCVNTQGEVQVKFNKQAENPGECRVCGVEA
jgi:hypothetical protein